jgi:hypothetical protein
MIGGSAPAEGTVRTMLSLQSFRACFLIFAFATAAIAPSANATQEVDLHDVAWFVHVDLIDAGSGEGLSFWQGVIDDAIATANLLVEGGQGPVDEPCCTRLGRSASVTPFGTSGDGFDVIDTGAEETALSGLGGSGSRAFLVDSITFCGVPAPNAIGCAVRPSCDGDGSDDPNLWLAVTVDAYSDGILGSVLSHERGHNACLPHASAEKCQIMQGTVFIPGEGGCLTASECENYENARTEASSGLECGCHDDVSGLVTNGSECSDVANGICSGGVCGESTGDASVHLLAAAEPGYGALAPESMIRISGLAGNWTNLGQISSESSEIEAMAYSTDSNILYGVIPTAHDDLVVIIDPVTGSVVGMPVGAIANGTDEITSMAYDPGATSAAMDDRLLVLEDGGIGELRAINPATPSVTTLLGQVLIGPSEEFSGLAYDSLQDRLFGAWRFGPTGFFEIDLTTCPPSPCVASSLSSWAPVAARRNASLAYSASTGMLYLVGTGFDSVPGEGRTFYTVVDPAAGTVFETLSLDRFTPAGLAAVPEPNMVIGITVGLLGLALTARGKNGVRVPARVRAQR